MISLIETVLEKVSSGNITLKELSQQLPKMSYKNITVDDCVQYLIQCEILFVDSNYLRINYAVDVDLFASILVMYQNFVKKSQLVMSTVPVRQQDSKNINIEIDEKKKISIEVKETMLNINAIPCKDKGIQTEESQLVVKIDKAVQTDVNWCIQEMV